MGVNMLTLPCTMIPHWIGLDERKLPGPMTRSPKTKTVATRAEKPPFEICPTLGALKYTLKSKNRKIFQIMEVDQTLL